ncbi:MAG TPA: Crp/Fnr family transcriptional regulator [Bacillota bacterium]|nr:Crp/Fnr family transcriptional regulator [Bacillota bacterium]HOL09176.1 Crp/Fnr family transcriptional regulator [Bacillota bacterium]HPO96851.1 Crp/Fnr family transcriptional regulator [Bacillota bacterium]
MELSLLNEIINCNPELYEIVKGCPYEILKTWEFKQYEAGTIIYNQGEQTDFVNLIIEGYADIYYMAENGKKYSQVIIKKGEIIGEFEIFDKRPYVCSVEALTDLKLLQIKQSHFIKWLQMDNSICFYLVKYLCNKFYLFAEKASSDTLYSLKARLCNYLLSCSRQEQVTKNDNGIRLKLNKEKISDYFAVTVRSINRILQSLKLKGIIEIGADFIIIKDLGKLIQEEELCRYE